MAHLAAQLILIHSLIYKTLISFLSPGWVMSRVGAENMAITMKPLADRVVVEPMESETMKGGIIIPDTAKEKPQQGKIVVVGPGKVNDAGERIKPEVKKGDIVLYGKYAGTEVTVGGSDYLILRESDVLAIL